VLLGYQLQHSPEDCFLIFTTTDRVNQCGHCAVGTMEAPTGIEPV
jgi:hypothetical protein